MSVVPARLVFLAFVGLTGSIIYNALYLQDRHSSTAVIPAAVPTAVPSPDAHSEAASAQPEPAKIPPVRTDLPPLQTQEAPEQLVTAVQRELTMRNYHAGPADGKLREETRRAISAYEKDHGLAVTGSPTDELLRHILLGDSVTPPAATGSVTAVGTESTPPKETSTVKAVQQILADLGYTPGPIDGARGGATERAISAFQHDRKIAQNGRITPELLGEIKRVTGRDLAGGAAHR
jgi:peptidoglycan hydrolase-like protein with peptidoglycan-binding domain